MKPSQGLAVFLIAASSALLVSCGEKPRSDILDEALAVKRTVDSFVPAGEDFFKGMDGGIALTPAEIRGRNTWLVWTGGNDRFWDQLSTISFGTLDFLKTISSNPSQVFARSNRWEQLGLVNEPCFEQATGPDPERFNLWLDKRKADCPVDPFTDEKKYPGVQTGSRGKSMAVGSYYGYPTGIIGLRLFPNPAFDDAAAKKWDAKRYYDDPDYYKNKDLIKPYRVGMSCAFCHVGPNPVRPPDDANNPKWENLSSNVGAQYFWVDRVFVWEAGRKEGTGATPSADEAKKRYDGNFAWQLFHTSRPGTLDTSFISTDSINNPRTMNALYNLGPRVLMAKATGKEKLGGGELDNKQFGDYPQTADFKDLYVSPDVFAPRILKDGSDSVGALGALNRVYINIGLYSEEWLRHFNPLVGGKRITPIEVATAQKNSSYWLATERQNPDVALFFLKTTTPHKLRDAPDGDRHMTSDASVLRRGKIAFAENCARCHSSKLPTPRVGLEDGGSAGSRYLEQFNKYWTWTKTDDFKAKMRDIVLAADFLDGNYLSTELRIPVTLTQTNACSPLATNALRGNIWDNFSSESYKELPSVGTINVVHPKTGETRQYKMPAGGRGYTRPPSLVSLWSTAPFLLNNTLGKFESSPSVTARMRSFDDSIEKLLWPEKREIDETLKTSMNKEVGHIDRTTVTSYLRVSSGYLPDALQELQGPLARFVPWLFSDDGIEIGPIPAGTPINLLANVNLLSESNDPAERAAHAKKLLDVFVKARRDLKALPENATDDQARKIFADLVDPLLELSKCPDFVVNRGHYFGTSFNTGEPGLRDEDKRALIEFLKTF